MKDDTFKTTVVSSEEANEWQKIYDLGSPEEKHRMEIELLKHTTDKARASLVNAMLRTSDSDIEFMRPPHGKGELMLITIRVPQGFTEALKRESDRCGDCAFRERFCFKYESFLEVVFRTALIDSMTQTVDLETLKLIDQLKATFKGIPK